MKLCLVAIFKNESHIMQEWITHYINQGVDKFFLIDNGSSDNYMEHIERYIQNNIITLIIDPTKYQQSFLYNKYFLKLCKKYDWCIVCDLDEFIYARNFYPSIKDYLADIDPIITQIFIPWKIFGSNGYNTIEKGHPESIIKSFTKRINYDIPNSITGKKKSVCKCIVRTSDLLKFRIHSHITKNQQYITSNNKKDEICGDLINITENILNQSHLHINHYRIQSLLWFINVKCTRGDVVYHENIRDIDYFYNDDKYSNNIEDTELSSIMTQYFYI